MNTLISAYNLMEGTKPRFEHRIHCCPSIICRRNKKQKVLLSSEGLNLDKHICLACRYGFNTEPEKCNVFKQLRKRYPTYITDTDILILKVKDVLYIDK